MNSDESGARTSSLLTATDKAQSAIVEFDSKSFAVKRNGKVSHGDVFVGNSSGRTLVADLTGATGAEPRLRQSWVTDGKTIQLSWGKLAANTSYKISRDGLYLGTVKSNTFIDRHPTVKAIYTVQAVAVPSPKEVKDQKLTSSNESFGYSWNIRTQLQADPNISQVMALPDNSHHTKVWYRTFIPSQYITIPSITPGCEYKSPYKHGGNNRGYNYDPYSSFKTQQAFEVSWTDPNYFFVSNQVGATHVYDSANKLVTSRTASNSGMKIRRMSAWAADRQDVSGTESVTNPFCSSLTGSIGSSWRIYMLRNGSYSMSGSHKQMPNHEIYMKYGSEWVDGIGNALSIKVLYKRDLLNPACLWGSAVCPEAQILSNG
ncbi:hypothetical protein PZ938_00080 [Luteipulveratus sp. YIM 133132]|uniref:hypothetical protein n=1 Tax=Luteipulveratus flavus TaxID=3031728 RepID=UPI0023B079B0|nr:hypothetical protein [Luteipulveratus sp. YIM 133132]MDE9363991.1 hypothetical protein [Luteipulveratus sp. YIM 133132]